MSREINHEYSLEGLMLKLKPVFTQYDAYRWLIGKVPDAEKDRGQKEKKESEDEVRWHHPCNDHEQTPEDSEGQGAWSAAVHGVAKSHTQPGNWTTFYCKKEKKKLVFLRLPYHKYLIPVATIDK